MAGQDGEGRCCQQLHCPCCPEQQLRPGPGGATDSQPLQPHPTEILAVVQVVVQVYEVVKILILYHSDVFQILEVFLGCCMMRSGAVRRLQVAVAVL